MQNTRANDAFKEFKKQVEVLKTKYNYLVQLSMLQCKGLDDAEFITSSVDPKVISNLRPDDPLTQLLDLTSTEKWHPVTYSVIN